MCCARIINGIGTGYLNAIVPVWSAEVATHTSRGAFIASEFTLNIFGVVVAYWLEFGLGFIGDGTSQVRWRVRNTELVSKFREQALTPLHPRGGTVPHRIPDPPGSRIYGACPTPRFLILTQLTPLIAGMHSVDAR